MFETVPFNKIVDWLQSKKEPLWIDKLGRRKKNNIVCHFFCSYDPKSQAVLITGDEGLKGKQSSIYRFDKPRWDAVMQFMGTLPYAEIEKTSRYSNAPIREVNMVFRSNPPAICRAYCEEKGGVR